MSNLPRSLYGTARYGTFRYGEGPAANLAGTVTAGGVTLTARVTALRHLAGTLVLGGLSLTGLLDSLRRVRIHVGTRATTLRTSTRSSVTTREDR